MEIKTIFQCYCELSRLMMQPKTESRDWLISMVEDQIELIRCYEKTVNMNSKLKKIVV